MTIQDLSVKIHEIAKALGKEYSSVEVSCAHYSDDSIRMKYTCYVEELLPHISSDTVVGLFERIEDELNSKKLKILIYECNLA